MSTRFYGSLCLTDMVEAAKKKHSAFTKADNGKIYCDTTIWLNDKEDKFGNIISVQLNPKKDLRELDGQAYIGNFKEAERKQVTNRDVSDLDLPDDIPAREKNNNTNNSSVPSASEITEPIDDLPF